MDSRKLKILVCAVLITFGIVVLFAGIRMFEKKGENNSSSNDYRKPVQRNDVEIGNFDYSLLKMRVNDENLIYSPLSIKYALFMLKEGAEGKTYEELNNLIGNLSLTRYQNIENVLSLANSVFIRDRYKEYVLDSYIAKLKNGYDAEVIFDEFKNAKTVNDWISKKTFNIINDMLSDDLFTSDELEMILVNALAIDMEWFEQFEPMDTWKSKFTKANGEEMYTAMMNMTVNYDLYNYYKDDMYTAVSMPLKNYNGTELEFIAVLPEQVQLKEFITSNEFENNLSNILNNLHSSNGLRVSLSIPRFEYNYGFSLVKDLQLLGVKEAFDKVNANFDSMSRKGLYVEDVIHKADIKFSERGIKAAAVTVIVMFDKNAIEEPVETVSLRFDRPFMYLIRDKYTGEVWFTGTVYEPVEWDKVEKDYERR